MKNITYGIEQIIEGDLDLKMEIAIRQDWIDQNPDAADAEIWEMEIEELKSL